MRKISLPPGFDLRTVQTVASRYIDWAIPALQVQQTVSYFGWPFETRNGILRTARNRSLRLVFFSGGSDLRKSVERCLRVNGLWGWASREWDYEECHMEGSGRIRVEPRSHSDAAWVPGSRSLFLGVSFVLSCHVMSCLSVCLFRPDGTTRLSLRGFLWYLRFEGGFPPENMSIKLLPRKYTPPPSNAGLSFELKGQMYISR